jgi:hypothetical protein
VYASLQATKTSQYQLKPAPGFTTNLPTVNLTESTALKVRRAAGAARDTAGVRVRQRVAGHGRPGVRDATAVAPHDPVPLERGLEGGGGVCALRLGVVPGDHADDFEREVAEDALQRLFGAPGSAGLSVCGGHLFCVFFIVLCDLSGSNVWLSEVWVLRSVLIDFLICFELKLSFNKIDP